MTVNVTFTNDAFPPGTEFSVEGIGVLKNGESTEVSDEQEKAFVQAYRQTLGDALQGEGWQVDGSPSIASVADALGVNPDEISFTPEIVPVEEVTETTGTVDLGAPVEQPQNTETNAPTNEGGEG